MTLPLYPFIMLAIWIEDGRPFFFGAPPRDHRRARVPLLKFRSMRKDAEKIKAQLRRRRTRPTARSSSWRTIRG